MESANLLSARQLSIMTPSIMTSSSRWQMHRNNWQKIHSSFACLIFESPFTCFTNDIILYYYSLKFNENWWNATPRCIDRTTPASYSMLFVWSSAEWFVCNIRLPNFVPFYPVFSITGDFKSFVQNKIFSKLTDPTFWAVWKWPKQLFLSSLRSIYILHSICISSTEPRIQQYFTEVTNFNDQILGGVWVRVQSTKC